VTPRLRRRQIHANVRFCGRPSSDHWQKALTSKEKEARCELRFVVPGAAWPPQKHPSHLPLWPSQGKTWFSCKSPTSKGFQRNASHFNSVLLFLRSCLAFLQPVPRAPPQNGNCWNANQCCPRPLTQSLPAWLLPCLMPAGA
jgi:hypothetical protein